MNLQTFKEATSNGVHLIKFSASWCAPCKMLERNIQDAKPEIEHLTTYFDCDVEANHEIAAEYGIMGVPRMMLFKDGEIVADISGFQSKSAVVDFVANHA